MLRCPAAQSEADAALGALLDDYVLYAFERHPESVTMLGLDRGTFGKRDRASTTHRSTSFGTTVCPSPLSSSSSMRLIASFPLVTSIGHPLRHLSVQKLMRQRAVFDWRGLGRPYVIDQLDYGSYSNIPRLLAAQQRVESEDDANAWRARLQTFPNVLDQELECVRFDAAQGIHSSGFHPRGDNRSDRELAQASAADSFVVRSLAAQTAEQGIAGDHSRVAARIWDNHVVPALRRQIEVLCALRPSNIGPGYLAATRGRGSLFRIIALRDCDCDERRRCPRPGPANGGRDQLAPGRVDAQAGNGAWQCCPAPEPMFEDPRFRYPSDEKAGRERLLKDAHRIGGPRRHLSGKIFCDIAACRIYDTAHAGDLEAGAAGGLYDPPSLDGSRPGVFWINLGDPADTSSFLLPTILHHEGVPGHHLQFSLAYEAAGVPLALKLWDFTAYTEGWAMYAEQLADEWGVYDDEPWSRIGYLQQALLRAARLVADTGLHAMRWSRAQALRYFGSSRLT